MRKPLLFAVIGLTITGVVGDPSTRAAEKIRQLAQADPHSSGRYRVVGAASNSAEFAKAFGCKPSSPMVRENACRVW